MCSVRCLLFVVVVALLLYLMFAVSCDVRCLMCAVVCCLLFVVCCVVFVTCCSLFVRCVLFGVRCVSLVGCWLFVAVCRAMGILRCLLFVV